MCSLKKRTREQICLHVTHSFIRLLLFSVKPCTRPFWIHQLRSSNKRSHHLLDLNISCVKLEEYEIRHSGLLYDAFSTRRTPLRLLEPILQTLWSTSRCKGRYYRITKHMPTVQVKRLIQELRTNTATQPLLQLPNKLLQSRNNLP